MADNFNMKQFLAENKLGAYSKLKEEKFYAPSYVAQKYGSKAKEIEDNIEDEKDNNPNIWDLYTSLETEKETDEFVKGFMNEGEAAYEYEKGKAAGEKEEKAKLTKEGGDEDKLPLTPKMKKFIDKVISDAKKDGEFEELVQVDYFENDLIDFILEKFDEEGNYDNVSQEVKDYINKSVKDYYKNPDGTPFFSEDLGQDRTDAEAEKMMDFLAEKDKTEEAIDAKSFGGILKSDNPEGDALVLRFLQGIAKKFEYPVSHAAMFVKERIKKLGY